MRGDQEYGNQHKHGVNESAKPATGAHLMQKAQPAESKEIHQTSSSFRGHLKLTFTDGTELQLERGQYDVSRPPLVGEKWPRREFIMRDGLGYGEPVPLEPQRIVETVDESKPDSGPSEAATDTGATSDANHAGSDDGSDPAASPADRGTDSQSAT